MIKETKTVKRSINDVLSISNKAQSLTFKTGNKQECANVKSNGSVFMKTSIVHHNMSSKNIKTKCSPRGMSIG